MKKQKTVLMVFLVFVFTLLLSGCGQKRVDVQTLLTVEQDYTGSRQIRLSINKNDFEKFFDGTAEQLNDQLDSACPSDLEWNYAEEEEICSYTFSLYFSSLEDYARKVENITGKKASIVMEQPESVFASGLLYQEDFGSLEIIGWLGTFLEKQGYLKEGQGTALFSESAVKLMYAGTGYELEAGNINVDTLVKTPVERIDILTHYKQNKHCDRQVVFTFSADSMNKNGDEIKAYLEKNRPDDAELVWTMKNGDSLCSVSAGDYTAAQLNHFMQEIFGESESFVNVQPQQRTGIFASAADWSEFIDVSDFSYNNNEKVAVGYYIQWEDSMDVTVHLQNSDDPIESGESEVYGGYQMVLEQEMMQASLVTEISTTYVIEDIEVDTEFNTMDNLSRSISLIFQAKPDQEDQENIRKRIAQKAKGVAEVTNGEEREDGRSSIVITQTGFIDDMNKGYQAIFDVQGQLAHKSSGDLLEFQHSGNFVELMDFTGFLENDPLMTTLTYHLKLPRGEKILEDTISSTADLKQGTQEVKGRLYTGTVQGAYLSLTLNTQKWNTDGMMLFFMILLFILAAIAVIFFADFIRKAFDRVKKDVRGFNDAFGKNDDMLEDFPEEGKKEKKDYLSVIKQGIGKFKRKKQDDAVSGDEDDFVEPAGWNGKSSGQRTPPLVEYEEESFEDEEEFQEDGEAEEDFDLQSLVEKVTELSVEIPDEFSDDDEE